MRNIEWPRAWIWTALAVAVILGITTWTMWAPGPQAHVDADNQTRAYLEDDADVPAPAFAPFTNAPRLPASCER